MEEKIKSTEEIWKENEEIADKLADCYYDSILEEYKDYIKNDTKENFGFNAFADGIRVGLDIFIPLLDKNMKKIVEEKINSMIEKRTKINKENEIILKVNCSYCGEEIECPEDMIKAEKHACFSCFKKLGNEIEPEDVDKKVHVDIPTEKFREEVPSLIASEITEKAFPKFWKDYKENLKSMSKKEIAKEMFGFGIEVAFDEIIREEKEETEDLK